MIGKGDSNKPYAFRHVENLTGSMLTIRAGYGMNMKVNHDSSLLYFTAEHAEKNIQKQQIKIIFKYITSLLVTDLQFIATSVGAIHSVE